MYPYIELFWYTIYFHWLGIVISTLVFLYWVYRYSKKANLRFSLFFNYIPLFIILPYLLWRWFYNAIEYHILFPDLTIFFPYGYKFSFIWVSVGFLIAMTIFLLNFKYSQERKKWFDVFFYSISLALIVVWPFFLLWDVFYGKPTNSIFWVNVLSDNTQIPYLSWSYWPVGIFLSFLGLGMYLLAKLLHLIFKKSSLTILLFPFVFLAFSYIFSFQEYPRHFLFEIDIKILYCWLVAIFWTVFFFWLINHRKW